MREIYIEDLIEKIPLFQQIHLWSEDWAPMDTWLTELGLEGCTEIALTDHIKNVSGTSLGWVFLQIDSREAHELLLQLKKTRLYSRDWITHKEEIAINNSIASRVYKVFLQDEYLELEGKRIPSKILDASCYPARYYIPAGIPGYQGEAFNYATLVEKYQIGIELFSDDLPSTGADLLTEFLAWDADGECMAFHSYKDLKKLYRASYVEVKSLKALRFLQLTGFDSYMNSPFKVPSIHMPRKYYRRGDGTMWGDWVEEVELEYLRCAVVFS